MRKTPTDTLLGDWIGDADCAFVMRPASEGSGYPRDCRPYLLQRGLLESQHLTFIRGGILAAASDRWAELSRRKGHLREDSIIQKLTNGHIKCQPAGANLRRNVACGVLRVLGPRVENLAVKLSSMSSFKFRSIAVS